jgi:hypothetical protein
MSSTQLRVVKKTADFKGLKGLKVAQPRESPRAGDCRFLLWMEEILHQSIGGLSHYL